MGKLIPFKQKQSSEEKALRKRLQTNPDDLETWGKLLVLKIQQGKFDPKSGYAEGILRCIIIHHISGRQKLFDLKNALFDIKDKYRNPAAYPANYPRERLESFKGLLFEKGFLKDYFLCVQVEK